MLFSVGTTAALLLLGRTTISVVVIVVVVLISFRESRNRHIILVTGRRYKGIEPHGEYVLLDFDNICSPSFLY